MSLPLPMFLLVRINFVPSVYHSHTNVVLDQCTTLLNDSSCVLRIRIVLIQCKRGLTVSFDARGLSKIRQNNELRFATAKIFKISFCKRLPIILLRSLRANQRFLFSLKRFHNILS